MQCVADGTTYVGGAVGALHVLKVRARHRRLRTEPAPPPERGATAEADATASHLPA